MINALFVGVVVLDAVCAVLATRPLQRALWVSAALMQCAVACHRLMVPS